MEPRLRLAERPGLALLAVALVALLVEPRYQKPILIDWLIGAAYTAGTHSRVGARGSARAVAASSRCCA